MTHESAILFKASLEGYLCMPNDNIVYKLHNKDYALLQEYRNDWDQVFTATKETQIMFALFILESENR